MQIDHEGHKECQLGKEEIMDIIWEDKIQGILGYQPTHTQEGMKRKEKKWGTGTTQCERKCSSGYSKTL